jgi:L-alanine-DL-glutamate epimerase-like enolase superfamily enzyme
MRIRRIDCELLHLPLSRPRASPLEAAAGRLNHIVVLLAHVHTDADLTGLGFAYALQSSGRALLATAVDDLAPLLLNEDPLDHERLASRVYWRLQTVGRRGLVQQAYSALDVALWDLKGKAAGLPLYKLLGGARDSARAYGSDSAWLYMSVEEIVEASQVYVRQGMGIKVKVGADADADTDRVGRLADSFGEDVWLAVDANERYDYDTALRMGRFFETEIGTAWFEEPLSCEDLDGHARLAGKLDLPIAGGEMLFGPDEFRHYIERGALAVVQPDITRLGGLTPTLRVIALAEQHGLPVSPHLLPEISVQLGCGLSAVTVIEYMPWLYPLFSNPPAPERGRLVPPPGPGLGLELNAEAVAKYRVETSAQKS